MRSFILWLIITGVLATLISCGKEREGDDTISIAVSQAMSTDDWRQQMNRSMKVEASLRPEVHLEIIDAKNSVEKQVQDIESFIAKKVDVIIVSPIQSKPLTAVVEKSIRAGIPVLVVDRKIEGENYTAYLGADNVEIGRTAAKYIVSNLRGSGNLIEITGATGSSPAYERSLGFNQVVRANSHVHILHTIAGNWEKESVKEPLTKLLRANPNIEYIFAHNDRMALSAWETAKTLGLEDKIKFIGVDGLNTPNGGIELVKDGMLQATILYPSGGNEAIRLAQRIHNKEAISKNNILNTILIDHFNAEIIENQMDKVDEQQSVIESQQGAIKVQEQEYASQGNLLRLLSLFLVIIFSLALYSVYSTVSISRKKRQLETINHTVVSQKEEIEQMAEIARLSNDAKLNFFTGLSHEFKTPITLIISYVESLIDEDKIKGTKLAHELKLIHNNSNRLLRLINQLLDFRKIEEHKFSIRATETDLCQFSRDMMGNFTGEAKRRNIDFTLDCPSGKLDAFIDRNLMDKVYFNLLSNAFKFTPDHGTIAISIYEESDNVALRFKDSGIGIPQEEIASVFTAFFKASNNQKNSSGIGLHLSKEFIELHKGTIEVIAGAGAEFIIKLPKGHHHFNENEVGLQSEDDYKVAGYILDSQTYDIAEKLPAANNENYSLLIIEDNTDLLNFLKNKLSTEYTVTTSDGSDALEKALETVPDIIICDVNLAGKDGFEISKQLKKDLRTSHIPIIILTALGNEESMIKGLQSGIDQYLTKPFSLPIVKQSLSNLLYNREKLRYYYTNNIYKVEPETKFGFPEQEFITKMNGIIFNNMDNSDFSVEELAENLKVSRVQLYRKVKAILGMSISDHINNIRLERAAELLKTNDFTISEIAYTVGFSSPNYFSTAFKHKFGYSPKEYKSKL
ncbi:substrate-binding domain-containing protein [Flavobacterium sp. Sd200]|uniref:hybrid sensor histidine kinase/response regulator transcription factor n=1 Tax=Flavobacterium sp. Sd200 TaxID=2692211 RepID=UPI00137005FC|nr:substrate-binding domain-containing protein [Flavobacterium sp. Sd200]MXN91665.1 substrate-binding domain-containing protein [Flavobacterium sp. Sd200]